ncbi:hypothetical protein VINI7043_07100 [Vibrio nigripulchritudo ATCC 27043]|uniref:hypothetical protein n=1 Tax=Vibrio nigripulchritudo TaxID=28173 RepID=UPI00021C14F3|nr:hypothetical protein [Vibrio nigripulchritudo]EGU57562.1 hypothetical protein VINI7043_07100 [Vibrio nigripulchritudo ATCC 27043]
MEKLANYLFENEISNSYLHLNINFNDVIKVIDSIVEEEKKSDSRKDTAQIRVYSEGNTALFDNEIRTCSVDSYSSLEEWGSSIFKGNKYGVVFNRCEKWNDELTCKIATVIKDIYKNVILDDVKFEITLFIGNYGWTPFGVHIDDKNSSVIHFHLGPGSKKMFTWKQDNFIKLTGSNRSFFEPEKILKDADSVCINSNDIFILPPNKYHIGYTPEFSVAIAVAVIDDNTKKRNANALKWAISNESWVTKNIEKRIVLNEFIKKSYKSFDLAKKSNFCFQDPPRMLDIQSKNIEHHSKLVLCKPFKIYLNKIDKNKIEIYFRGRSITVNHSKEVENMIKIINRGYPFSIINLFEELCKEKESIVDILKVLLSGRAIKIYE